MTPTEEIQAVWAKTQESNNAYRSQPFAASHVCQCLGDCGGYVCINARDSRGFCDPCADRKKERR